MLMSSLLSQGQKCSTCIQRLSPFYLLINKLWVEHRGKWVLISVWKVPHITHMWGFAVSIRCRSHTSPVWDAFWELCNLTWLSIKKVWEGPLQKTYVQKNTTHHLITHTHTHMHNTFKNGITLHTESADYLLCLSSLCVTARVISVEGIGIGCLIIPNLSPSEQ